MPADDNTGTTAQRDAALFQAKADIVETRERLAHSVMALEQRMSRAVDWREWIRQWPGRSLALAFAAGWFLGRRH